MGIGRSGRDGCKTSMVYGRSGREEGVRRVLDMLGVGGGRKMSMKCASSGRGRA